tara:strand:+ start:439 stop:996 length:558 start_codon:yes stop_codon:yes gene_type:complete
MLTRSAAAGVRSLNDGEHCIGSLPVDDDDLTRVKDLVTRQGVSIFNPDKKRLMLLASAEDPLVERLRGQLEREEFLVGRVFSTPSFLHSRSGCLQQRWHTDYDVVPVQRSPVKPLGVLLALQPDTEFLIDGKSVFLERGDFIVFNGDAVHAGASYATENTRVHAYLDVRCVHRPHDTTYGTLATA